MAAADVQAARVATQADTLWRKLRDVLQVRTDVTTLGGETFLAPALDGDPDPIPDLSAAQLIAAMTALAAVNNALGADTEAGRKGLLNLFFTPDVAVGRARTSIKELREALTDFRALQADLTDSANGSTILAYLTAAIGEAEATKVVDGLTSLTLIDTTLNAGAGTRRKDLNRAAD